MGARVLEVGCGTGAISRIVAARPEVREVLGVDPSRILLETARQLSAAFENLSFQEGRRAPLPLESERFDAVVLRRVLLHVPEPAQILAEAFRVLAPEGRLAVFDGDYATITLARGDAFRPADITDPWLMRRLSALATGCGFAPDRLRGHGYAQVQHPEYMLSIADRGADALAAAGTIGPELAAAP